MLPNLPNINLFNNQSTSISSLKINKNIVNNNSNGFTNTSLDTNE
jgi:hypothetical protein